MLVTTTACEDNNKATNHNNTSQTTKRGFSKKANKGALQSIMSPEESTTDTCEGQPMLAAQHHAPSRETRNKTSRRAHFRVAETQKKRSVNDRFQSIVEDNVKESNSYTANVFSNSLVDTALHAAPTINNYGDSNSGTEASSSLSSEGDLATSSSAVRQQNSGANRESSSGTSTRHVVTATTGTSTQTGTGSNTSSGDDQTSSKASVSGGGNLETRMDRESPSDLVVDSSFGGVCFRHHHLRRHQSHHRKHRALGDGSTLRLPDDDGSDQLSTGPTTVVASYMPPPNYSAAAMNTSGKAVAHDVFLLQPNRDPGYHAIRRTFDRLPKRHHVVKMETSSSSEGEILKMFIKRKHRHPKVAHNEVHPPKPYKKRQKMSSNSESEDIESSGGGSSSGSGTEGGYMGSADSKQNDGSSSPSLSSSSDDAIRRKKPHQRLKDARKTPSGDAMKVAEAALADSSSSSELADFSSGTSFENGDERGQFGMDPYHSTSPSLSSSNEDESTSSVEDYEDVYRKAKSYTIRKRFVVVDDAPPPAAILANPSALSRVAGAPPASDGACKRHPSIFNIGSDIMAHILTFLPPPVILDVLTMPLSKEWRQTFTSQPELWRVLCLVEPFKAEILDNEDCPDRRHNSDDDSSSNSSFCPLNGDIEKNGSARLDRYRLLYTSFVRCMKYLSQIRDDALSGRAPSYIDYGVLGNKAYPGSHAGINRDLQSLLSNARVGMDAGDSSSAGSESSEEPQKVVAGAASLYFDEVENKKRKRGKKTRNQKTKFGQSMITDRLLGPSASGLPGSLALPWSCAVYSIVNWMVSFSDVEGIQTLCLKVLPFLLEDELQRQTAQRAGLTDVVLRAMLLFPDSVQLHIAAFHTIVLLARPLGGREGMLFHSSMVLTGIFGGQNNTYPKSGIAIMIESMKRFEGSDVLQAMSCWALVNIALAPSQKAELVKLGGIKATTNAMKRHPFSAEVQFRALFALINLVIPSVRLNREEAAAAENPQSVVEVPDYSEKEIIDESVEEITTMVVRAMKNFCSSEAILNRACLVLHNLSLTSEYHPLMLFAPNCYQMLEWSLANYRTDQVLQQSALGTLQRLQSTLSNNEAIRVKFTQELQSQQQATLYKAHREAMRLHRRQEELLRAQQQEVDGQTNPVKDY